MPLHDPARHETLADIAWDAQRVRAQSLDAAMAIEDRQQVILSATEDHKEALAAFLGKRPPEYRER